MENEIRGLRGAIERESKQMEASFSKVGAVIGGVFSAAAAKGFIETMIRVRGEYQKFEAVLTNTLGSNDLAKSALGMIQDYAARTPFQLNEITGAYIKLVNQGIIPTSSELTKLGDLAASTGKGFDQLAEAIIDAQTGEFERLKEFGIRASKSGDQVAFTFKGVERQVAFTSEGIKAYLISLGDLEGVTGSTAAISKTLTGQISNLEDSWNRMFNELGQKSEGVLSDSIGVVASLVDHYEDVGKVLAVLIATYGSYKAAIIATSVAEKLVTTAGNIKAWFELAKGIQTAKDAQIALNLAVSANPYALVISSVVALATGIALFGDSLSSAEELQKELNDRMDESQLTIDQEKEKINQLVSVAKNDKLSKGQRLEAINKLNAVAPEYLNGISLETINTKQATDAINEYILALDRKLKVQALTDQKLENLKKLNALNSGEQEKIDEALGTSAIGKIWRKFTGTLTGGGNPILGETLQIAQDANDARTQIIKQNEQLDADIKKTLEDQAKTVEKGGAKVVIKNKEYYQGLLEAEQKAKNILDISSGQGQKQLAEHNKKIAELQRTLSAYDDPKSGSKSITEKLFPEGSIAEFDRRISRVKKQLEELPVVGNEAKISSLNQQLLTLSKSRADAEKLVNIKSIDEELEYRRQAYHEYEQALDNEPFMGAANRLYAGLLMEGKSYADFLQNKLVPLKKEFAETGTLSTSEMYRATILQKEYNNAVGNTTPLETFRQRLDESKESASSLAEYVQKLEEELQKLEGDNSAGANAKRKDITERIVGSKTELKKLFADFITETNAFLNKRKQIEEHAQNLSYQARQKFTGKELDQQLEAIQDQKNKEMEAAVDAEAEKVELYAKTSASVKTFYMSQLDAYIATLEEEMAKYKEATEVKIALEKKLAEARSDKLAATLNDVTDFASAITSSFSNATIEISKYFKVTFAQLTGLGSNISTALKGLKKGASSQDKIAAGAAIGDAVSTIIVTARNALLKDSDFENALTDQEKAAQKVYDGLEGINLLLERQISLVDELYGSNKWTKSTEAIRKLREEQEKLLGSIQKDGLKFIESSQDYFVDPVFGTKLPTDNDYFRIKTEILTAGQVLKNAKIELGGIDTSQLKTLDDALALLAEIKRQGGTIDGKEITKTSLDAFEYRVEEWKKYMEEEKQLTDAQNEYFTATTRDSIADAIVDGFMHGKRSAQDFASDFESMMQKALVNSFKARIQDQLLNQFYERFAYLAGPESDMILTPDEMQELQDLFSKNIENAAVLWQQIEEITGKKLAELTGQGDALQGAIKGVSEDTASIISGQMNAIRINQAETQAIIRQQLLHLSEIAGNTRYNHYLESIDNSLKRLSSQNGLRDLGISQ